MAETDYIVSPMIGEPHTHTVVFFHGEGHQSGFEFARDFFKNKTQGQVDGRPKTLREIFPTIRWVFPSAPMQLSERTGDMTSRWFDTWSTLDPNKNPETQVHGIRRTIRVTQLILGREQQLVPHENIFLGGLGHGFAASYMAYFLGKRFAGLIGLGTWVPGAALPMLGWMMDEIQNIVEQHNNDTPMFFGHSRNNWLVPVEQGRSMYEIFTDQTKARVEYHEYDDGGAWIATNEIDDLAEFLQRAAFDEWSLIASFQQLGV
ncbi:phospholipase/carboxylesterase [Jackrogersella minutella]|nr:phospholipase/carboxylesterase [Jackrogersella minutella]